MKTKREELEGTYRFRGLELKQLIERHKEEGFSRFSLEAEEDTSQEVLASKDAGSDRPNEACQGSEVPLEASQKSFERFT